MNSDHVKGWRNYLTRQMQAVGMEEKEAQEIAERWLKSVEVRAAAVAPGSPESDDRKPEPQVVRRTLESANDQGRCEPYAEAGSVSRMSHECVRHVSSKSRPQDESCPPQQNKITW